MGVLWLIQGELEHPLAPPWRRPCCDVLMILSLWSCDVLMMFLWSCDVLMILSLWSCAVLMILSLWSCDVLVILSLWSCDVLMILSLWSRPYRVLSFVLLFNQHYMLNFGGGGVTTLWVCLCIFAGASVLSCVSCRWVGAQLIGALIPLGL